MKIKLAGTLVAMLAGMSFSGISTVPAWAQGTGTAAPGKPATSAGKPANTAAKPANTQAPAAQSNQPGQPGQPNDMEMQGSLKINSPGFKGNIQFDGNPLSLIQIPGITTPAKPAHT